MSVDVPFVKYNRKDKGTSKKQMDSLADDWAEKKKQNGSVLSRMRSMVDDFNQVDIKK